MPTESEIIGGVVNAAKSTADVTFMVILGIIILIILIAAFMYWRFIRSFKHTIILREKTKGSTDLVSIDKFRYLSGNGETESIQLWRTKELKPVPPDAARDFKRNGTEFIEGWLSETGEVKYINSTIESIGRAKFGERVKFYTPNFIQRFIFWLKTFKDNNRPPIKPEFIKYLEQDDKPSGKINFISIETKDKEFYANQHFKALRFKKKDFLTWVSENSGLIVVVFMVIMVFAFWQEITTPMAQVAERLAKVSENQAKLMADVTTLVKQRQIIEAETAGYGNITRPD